MAKLYFYYGAMGARKTAEAIMTAFNYEEKGMKPFCISPARDTRGTDGYWESRMGLNRKADLIVHEDTDILKEVIHEKFDVIIVDEAQFLDDAHIWQLAEIVVKLNVSVMCYGLRTDFRGDLFKGSYRLMCLAHEIGEIKTMAIGEKATMNARLVDGKMTLIGEQIQVGGNESYTSMSLKEWMKGKADEEARLNKTKKEVVLGKDNSNEDNI